jgi:hypothetical protein
MEENLGNEHVHEHGNVNDHDHTHFHPHSPHDHEHLATEHTHDHEHLTDPAKIKALLEYMIDHNRQHGEEIAGLAHSLYHAGQNDAADLLCEAAKDFESRNDKIAKALALLNGEKA